MSEKTAPSGTKHLQCGANCNCPIDPATATQQRPMLSFFTIVQAGTRELSSRCMARFRLAPNEKPQLALTKCQQGHEDGMA